MPDQNASPVRVYAVAAATIGAAVLVRVVLTPFLGGMFPLATTFSAVAFVVWYGGWGPALFTAVGGFLAVDALLIPGNSLTRPLVQEIMSFGVYLASCVSIILLGEAMRKAQRRLETGQRHLSSANLALESKVDAQSLLVNIHDATRGLSHPAAVMLETATRVGLHFHATRCAYGEVNTETAVIEITKGYTNGVPTVAGRYPLEVFGPVMVSQLKAGRTVVISDVARDPLTDTTTAHNTFERMQIVSMICVPLLRSQRLMAVMVLCDGRPRAWTRDDAELVEQVAERSLFAVEGARAAAKLRENLEVLALAMGAGKMGAWSRDLTLDTVWWSTELAVILGLPPDHQDFSGLRLLDLLTPEDRERLPAAIQEALATRRDYALEFKFKHATTGEWRWMEARGKATYNTAGQPQMLYGLGIDITEQKRAVEALQEADRRKDDFLATLAHELRNPLAPISSGLQILRAAGDDPAAASQAREIMERQVAQMTRLVDDLLDVARITTGKVELRYEPMDLAGAVRDAVETAMPLITLGGQVLRVTTPDEPVYVNADRTRLAQVFANLLNNSTRYSEAGQTIEMGVSREGDQAVVRVRDAGLGIHPDILPRVFEMFRQADRTGSRSRGGLGIGLFIVRRIVETHGGTVEALSAGLSQGTEVVVRLPADERAVPPANASARSGDPVSMARRRILVVDDNADAAESLAVLLSIGGHDTRVAHDGEAAIEAAGSFRPEIVFLDIGMPTVDGYETARRMRALPGGVSVVLVALTGWGQAEDRRRSKEAGFDHHLVKPADPTVVANLIASL